MSSQDPSQESQIGTWPVMETYLAIVSEKRRQAGEELGSVMLAMFDGLKHGIGDSGLNPEGYAELAHSVAIVTAAREDVAERLPTLAMIGDLALVFARGAYGEDYARQAEAHYGQLPAFMIVRRR